MYVKLLFGVTVGVTIMDVLIQVIVPLFVDDDNVMTGAELLTDTFTILAIVAQPLAVLVTTTL